MLEILVGPIASGKSTFCKRKAKGGAIIVNDDSIVTALHGGDYTLYSKKLKPVYKSVENAAIQAGLMMGRLVVVDRPNHSAAMRRRYIALGKSFDAKVTVVLFKREPPEVHAKRRFYNDHRDLPLQHWEEACRIHESLYEPPDKDREGFDYLLDMEKWDLTK